MFLTMNSYKNAPGTFLNLIYLFKNDVLLVYLGVRNLILGSSPPPPNTVREKRQVGGGGGSLSQAGHTTKKTFVNDAMTLFPYILATFLPEYPIKNSKNGQKTFFSSIYVNIASTFIPVPIMIHPAVYAMHFPAKF
jgi:hypothetical protein